LTNTAGYIKAVRQPTLVKLVTIASSSTDLQQSAWLVSILIAGVYEL
jgi:hypothetical protein